MKRPILFWIKYIAIVHTIALVLFAFEVIRGEMMRRQYEASLEKAMTRMNAQQDRPADR